MEVCERLQGWWVDTGAQYVPAPASEEQVKALEARYGITLPDDFRAYLRTACPAGEAWDDESGTWWDFNRIKSIPEELKYEVQNPVVAAKAAQYLFFVDHLVWCWAWAISCTDDENRGKVVLVPGLHSCPFVADSFSSFVERYIEDWPSVSPSEDR